MEVPIRFRLFGSVVSELKWFVNENQMSSLTAKNMNSLALRGVEPKILLHLPKTDQ